MTLPSRSLDHWLGCTDSNPSLDFPWEHYTWLDWLGCWLWAAVVSHPDQEHYHCPVHTGPWNLWGHHSKGNWRPLSLDTTQEGKLSVVTSWDCWGTFSLGKWLIKLQLYPPITKPMRVVEPPSTIWKTKKLALQKNGFNLWRQVSPLPYTCSSLTSGYRRSILVTGPGGKLVFLIIGLCQHSTGQGLKMLLQACYPRDFVPYEKGNVAPKAHHFWFLEPILWICKHFLADSISVYSKP